MEVARTSFEFKQFIFIVKLVALLTEDDPMLSSVLKALQNKVEMIKSNSSYFNHFVRDSNEPDGLIYMECKLVFSFTLRNAMMKTLHKAQPNEFGKKYLVHYIWWPHIKRQINFHGINCSKCTKTGENTKKGNSKLKN